MNQDNPEVEGEDLTEEQTGAPLVEVVEDAVIATLIDSTQMIVIEATVLGMMPPLTGVSSRVEDIHVVPVICPREALVELVVYAEMEVVR